MSSQQFLGSYPGFDLFGHGNSSQVIVDTVRGKTTHSLSKSMNSGAKDRACANKRYSDLITEELADETSNAVDELFGSPHGASSIYLFSGSWSKGGSAMFISEK